MFDMKKLSLRTMVSVLSLAAVCAAPAMAADKSVAVTAIVEHPALDAIRDGVKDELKAEGFETGKNLKWEYQSAQGNTGTAAQIARKFVGDKPDVIVAIATPSAQALVASTKTIPVVYSGVTDPIAAQLVKDWKASGGNVTGVSDLLELEKQVDLIKRIVPGVKRVGMVYNPGEANSAVVVKSLKELLSKSGISLVEAAAPRTVDVGAAAKSLIGKVDVIYTNTDNNVVSAYESLVKVGNDAKIPLIASDTDSVKRGAIAALGVNYYDLGRQTGKVVVRILKGEKPGDIASATSSKSLRAVAGALALAAICAAPVLAADKTVLVTSIVEHPALDAVRDGTKDELKAEGFEAGKNLKWEFQSAQGNAGTAGQIARKFVGDNPDVIVAIATPSAQPLVAATKTIPVVYSAIADPIAAQLVKDWAPSGTNVTGLSHMLDPNKQVEILKKVVPGVKRVGIVYNPGEANSVSALNSIKAVLEKQGIKLVEAAAPRSVDVSPAAKSLIGKVDAIYSTTDNNVVSTYEALVKVCNDAKIPLIASDTDSVKRGAIAALGVNFYDLGRQTGKVVARILRGEKPGDIPSSTSKNLELFVNTAAAQKQGVTLSPEFVKSATKVFN